MIADLFTLIDNTQDVIDSRDVIDRLEELGEDIEELCGDELAEFEALRELAKEASDYAPDWQYGEALIRDSYFKEYAQELAEDCGMVNPDARWPNNCIDWEQAARALQMDYTVVDFDGVDYWIRS